MKGVGIRLVSSPQAGEVLNVERDMTFDSDGKILSGVAIGEVTEQNIAILLMARKGEFKEFPNVGVGLIDALLDDDLLGFRHSIREEFKKDGLTIELLELYDLNKIDIKAKY
jgi:hypothetical protein